MSQLIAAGKEEGNAANRWQNNCIVAPLALEACEVTAYEARKDAAPKKLSILEKKLDDLKLQEVGDSSGKFGYDEDVAKSNRIDNRSGSNMTKI